MSVLRVNACAEVFTDPADFAAFWNELVVVVAVASAVVITITICVVVDFMQCNSWLWRISQKRVKNSYVGSE